jgi:hypothetical protein
MLAFDALGIDALAMGVIASSGTTHPPGWIDVPSSRTVNFDGGNNRANFDGGMNRVDFSGGTNRVNF